MVRKIICNLSSNDHTPCSTHIPLLVNALVGSTVHVPLSSTAAGFIKSR
jgi:hypothetical protein